MKARKDKFPFLQINQPWHDNSNSIWLASTLIFHRNLRAYSFVGKLDAEHRQHVFALLCRELLKSPIFDQPQVIKAEEIGPLEKEFLFEHFLQKHSFQQAMAGEGFVLDRTGTLFALLNIRDHLQLQMTEVKGELETAWNRLVQVEASVGNAVTYAFSPRFGFLTSEPRHCGTGLVARAFLHLPALIRTDGLDEALEKFGEDEIRTASVQGRMDEIIGDILTVSNRCTIGLNDEQLLQSVRTYVTKLLLEEKRCRARLLESPASEIKDFVSRAYGALRYSYHLEMPEAWGAISLLKLGHDLGWVTGTTHAVLNELFFAARRAHLVCEYTEELSQEELPHRRAEFIHASLADTDLKI
jgi:protein arginine kinase